MKQIEEEEDKDESVSDEIFDSLPLISEESDDESSSEWDDEEEEFDDDLDDLDDEDIDFREGGEF